MIVCNTEILYTIMPDENRVNHMFKTFSYRTKLVTIEKRTLFKLCLKLSIERTPATINLLSITCNRIRNSDLDKTHKEPFM